MLTSQYSRTVLLFVSISLIGGCSSNEKSETANSESEAAKASSTDNAAKSEIKQPEERIVQLSDIDFEFVKPELNEEELREGWISLFDGSSLFGWRLDSAAQWRVEDGSLVADSGDPNLLMYPFSFSDFEFRCEFKLEEKGNSGVFLRSAAKIKSVAKDTYELNICDDHKSFPTGSFVERAAVQDVPAVDGDWHSFHVVCDGEKLVVKLDDVMVHDLTDDTEFGRRDGMIGLQYRTGKIAFRNIFVKPLKGEELFNGKDLAGWHDVPGGESKFEVQDESLHAESGRGFLETDQTFGDFMLHVEANIKDEKAIADGRPANSGVFFRAMKGTEKDPSNGYEMQIQHDFKNEDRKQPLDFGSGGIYRRLGARYVVADNNQWFTETLIAQGNRIATFVNGYPVLQWVDDRAADENPRKGQRIKAGHLSLQGHDPTTDLLFRSLRVHKLPSAN